MRYALVLGNSEYDDQTLARLNTPISDAQALAKALSDPLLGQFDSVISIVNQPEAAARRGISQFLAQKKPDDLVLLYFSCHGILDERGRLYLAAKDTQRDLLKATGISASYITDEMDSCRSRRQVLILDCCYGGAFARGTKSADAKALTQTTFEGAGYGRVVLTASDSTQFALEGDQVVEQAEMSLFTHFMLNGLTTGEADLDSDGQVTLDELYDYTYNRVVSQTPRQTPCKWSYNQQGELVIARNPRPIVIKPAVMPSELREALDNPYSSVRLGAIEALRRMLESSEKGVVLTARMALERLQNDDSRSVSEAATRLLVEAKPAAADLVETHAPAVVTPAPPSTFPDVHPRRVAQAEEPFVKNVPAAAPVPKVKKSAVSLLSGLPRNFWPGWIGALVAGGVFLIFVSLTLNGLQSDNLIFNMLGVGMIGMVTGSLQWLILRHKIAWAGRWLAGNIAILAGIGGIAPIVYQVWNGWLIFGLLLGWALANLILGPVLVKRQLSSLPTGGEPTAVESQRLDGATAVRDWRLWLVWLGCALLVVLAYLAVYEGVIRNDLDYSKYMVILLGITGGFATLLQWALLSRYRTRAAAWVPANILILAIVGIFTGEDPTVQRFLLFTWFVLNQVIGMQLVLRSGGAGKVPPRESRKPGAIFWTVWVGMLLIGIGLAYLAKVAIDQTGGDNSPANYFVILAFIGGVIGLGQWLALRGRLPYGWWWMGANVLFLGWVGYALSPYHSDIVVVGESFTILYFISNLVLGPALAYIQAREAKPAA